MKHRLSHFMKADMLPSQFDALEEPSDAIVVDISPQPSAIVAQILARLPRPRRNLRGRADQQHTRKRRARVKPAGRSSVRS
jgi:hypothetical protein